MEMKSMKGERREQFEDFIKRAENGDRQPDLTKYHYWQYPPAVQFRGYEEPVGQYPPAVHFRGAEEPAGQ